MCCRSNPNSLISLAGLRIALFVSLLLGSAISDATGQGAKPNTADDFYAGIELTNDGIETIALRVSQSEEDTGFKLIYSDSMPLPIRRASTGKFAPQTSVTVAQAVQSLQSRLRQQYRVPPEHIYLIGNSRLGADSPEDLAGAIAKATGLKLTFLDALTEVQLSVVGTLPRLGKVGATLIDNRNSSVLIDIGSTGLQGGYEFLKYSQSAIPVFDFAAMSLPRGPVNYANEATQTLKESGDLPAFVKHIRENSATSLRQALRQEAETKPGMIFRKRVFLTGAIVRAIVTMLYPEDRQAFVPLSYEAIAQFAEKAGRNPQILGNPAASSIRDPKLRQEVEQELEVIRNTFTPRQLIAGAELLKAMADELRWQEKKIWYARIGQFGCILSYVRLQIGKS